MRWRLTAHAVARVLVAIALALAFSLSAWAEPTCKVAAVCDGDTLTVLVNRPQMKVRLAEIDAPERKQPFGEQSRQSLADLCFGNDAVLCEAGHG